jgi:formate/nitrite transporter FocA (FNT family)
MADEQHEQEVQELSAPTEQVVYGIVLKEGRKELERPSSSLFFSGVAAGLSMGASFIAEGLLKTYLPEAEWSRLVSKLGYSVGFLLVILGRQQLFTENTLTPVIPLLRHKTGRNLLNLMRLWIIVLAANFLGAFIAAFACRYGNVFEAPVRASFSTLGARAVEPAFLVLLVRGIFAGWLIALLVWLLPFAEMGRIWVIIIITYFVGVGDFSHIIAGMVEGFYGALDGVVPWPDLFLKFIPAVLIGNCIGGVALVAALNHAQVVSGSGDQHSGARR